MAARYPVSFEIQNRAQSSLESSNDVAELVLGPFSRIPKLEFADVEIGTETVQIVKLRNPTDSQQSVVVILPHDFSERGFSVNCREFEIPPYSAAELTIHFKPLKELQCRDTIYVKDKFRNQKSQFQLTSRAIRAIKKITRKRKTWNINKKPVVVPTSEQNEEIESHPPATPLSRPIESSVERRAGAMNVTFPVVSVTGHTLTTESDSTYQTETGNELSTTLFDDSLEVNKPVGVKQDIRTHVQYISKTDSFTFDSFELCSNDNKENPVAVSAKKKRMIDMNFSDIGFDNLTPDRTEVRSCLKSIENVSHNTSTPLVNVAKVKYTETTTYTTVTSVKQEMVSPNSHRAPDDSRVRDSSTGPKGELRKEPEHPKLEPTSPAPCSSRHQMETVLLPVKEEPVTPCASRAEASSDPSSAFKVPRAICPKLEAFTPIPQSDSMRKLAVAFAISPPKGTQSSRRELFGKGSYCSTPREKKPIVRMEPEESFHSSKTFNVKASDLSTSRAKASGRPKKTKSSSQSPNKTERGTTLSPKSLVAFKKSIRVHVPPRNSSRPSSARSDCSTSEPVVVVDLHRTDFKGPLYHLNIYGATTVADPFARCAIHPLEFREKQGQQLIRWVNSVLTPPEEYSACEAGVDVASLWKKSILDNVPLPPSRETVSSKFHKNEIHLLNLRKAAHLIFKSSAVGDTLYKVYSKIDVGYISVKDDLDLHSDQGARYHLVKMLMYYNPLWLRIGLETIYGKDIPLQPRQTVIGLMHFIRNNLLTDKYIVDKYSYQNIQHLKMPKFKKEMNDFIVFKFFSLVFFLDLAKQRAIVPYDPCLFNKSSPIKESEGMINEFIKEFIKCVGHMKRNLASIGFVLTHKQTAVDEYDFAVQTHLDLRDGANLTRLMEIILQKKHLIRKLRLPSISRLQKVHNVKLAFRALAEEKVPIVDVVPSDVVDGHFEKTMSLLWQILHKFLKPRMEKSAVMIQRWWRKQSFRIEIDRRVQLKRNLKVEAAAVKMQSVWRGYLLRKRFFEVKIDLQRIKYLRTLMKRNAAIKIQRWYRANQLANSRKQHSSDLQVASARKIQTWYRNQIEAKRMRNYYRCMKESAVVIQRWYRATVAMKMQKKQYKLACIAVVTIQRHCRAVLEGKRQRAAFLQMKMSAITIQRQYRATMAMKKQRQDYEIRRTAVVTIQRHYRSLFEGRRKRGEFLQMKKSAIIIQQWYRASVAMKKQKQAYEITRTAVVTIQRHYRSLIEGRKKRGEFLQMKKSAIIIQQWYRASVAMMKQKQEYDITRTAVVTIQRHYRAMVEGRRKRGEFLQMIKSSIIIQRWYRALIAMMKQKQEYEITRTAVVTIQRHYRSLVEGRRKRGEFLQMKKSAIIIQQWYRASVAMKKQKQAYEITRTAVVTIQRHYRAMVEGRRKRGEFLQMIKSSIIIQRWYRALIAMMKQKQEYDITRTAVVTIQRHYRALVEGRRKHGEFLQMKKSAIIIQRWYRASIAMEKQKQEYDITRTAVVTIQRHYRALVEGRRKRGEFLQMKKSAIIIQRWYRASIAMKKQKQEYDITRTAVVTIQRHYRALFEGRRKRGEFLQMKKSAIIIQRWYRASVAMKKQKQEYDITRTAVVTIQRHYRAVVEGRRKRGEFLQMKKSAIIIQRWYRASVAMRKQKQEYDISRTAVVTIQRHYRALVEGRRKRGEFLQMKKSAIIIQQWYRASVAMRKQKQEYDITRTAVVTIQRHYRAVVEGRRKRGEFLQMKKSAIIIQRWYRASVAMKKQKQEYDISRTAVVTIQRHYRALVEGRRKRGEFLQMKKSAIIIQQWYRASVAMRKQKQEYDITRTAVVTIQRHYRALVEGRMKRGVYIQMKKCAIIIQQWYRASVAMRKQKQEYDIARTAVVTIQRHYRAVVEGRRKRGEFLQMKKSAIIIQRWYRASVAMKKQKQEYDISRTAVVTIQRHYRALVEGRRKRGEFLQMKKSAIIIQQWYRASVAMKKQKQEYDITRTAVVTIQRHYRALVEGRIKRGEYIQMKKCAIIIQQWYRASVAMKKQKQEYDIARTAVVTIQRHYRALVEGRRKRGEFLQLKKSAIIIQQWYRASVAMKKQKQEYDITRTAVVTIQRHYRALVEGRIKRGEYIQMKKCAIIIQQWYRASVAMKKQKQEYDIARTAVVTIQRHYRAVVEGRRKRGEFLQMKKSATIIQRWYRASVAMKKQKQEYDITRTAVVTIQRHYRALVEGRRKRGEFLLMIKSSIIIQRWYRASVAMKKLKQEFDITRSAVVTIQRHYRAVVEGRKQLAQFLRMKSSAIIIQRWYRASIAMKKQKKEYDITRTSVLTIQRHYRAVVVGRKQRAHYLEVKNSRVDISRSVAAEEELLASERQCQAALLIWRWYWRCKAARITRCYYLLLREKTVFIQRRFRALQARKINGELPVEKISSASVAKRSLSVHRMKKVKEEFMLKSAAAIKIQRWYRSILNKKQQARSAQLMIAGRKILDWYQLVVIMRRERQMFLSQKQAAIRIQRYYRAYRLRAAAVKVGAESPIVSSPTLGTKYEKAIDILLSPKFNTSLNWNYISFKSLDVVTKYSPVLCERLAEPELTRVFSIIFQFLDTESRSDAYQAIFGHGMNVLLHLALYQKTYEAVWQNTVKYKGLDILLFLMGKFIEKKEDLFCRAATLIWLFSLSKEQRQENKNKTELNRRLSFYAKKIMATHKNVNAKKYKLVLPSLKTDWGYSKGEDVKEFGSRLDAILGLNKFYNFIKF